MSRKLLKKNKLFYCEMWLSPRRCRALSVFVDFLWKWRLWTNCMCRPV